MYLYKKKIKNISNQLILKTMKKEKNIIYNNKNLFRA